MAKFRESKNTKTLKLNFKINKLYHSKELAKKVGKKVDESGKFPLEKILKFLGLAALKNPITKVKL